MIPRLLQRRLQSSLQQFPAVVIYGPRQVGKTTLAKMLLEVAPESIYLDLELPSHANRFENPEHYLRLHQDKLMVIDEIQRMPELFPVLRGLIDEKRRPGRFLLLGSASGRIVTASSESLAGRVDTMQLFPLNILEVSTDSLQHWWKGGFPEAFLSSGDQRSRRWTDAFIRTFVERDLPLLDIRISPSRMIRLLQMLSHLHGNLLNASELARSLDVSPPTVGHYLDVLEDTLLIRSFDRGSST